MPDGEGNVEESAPRPLSEPGNRVYYRSPEVVVTDEWLVLREDSGSEFRIDIARMMTIDVAHLGTKRRRLTVVAVAATLTMVLGGAAANALAGRYAMVFVLGAAGSIALNSLVSLFRSRNDPQWKMFSRYLGGDVFLYASNDARTFFEVQKSLHQAMLDSRGRRRNPSSP